MCVYHPLMSTPSAMKNEEATSSTTAAQASGGGRASEGGKASDVTRVSGRSHDFARADSKKLDRQGSSPNLVRRRSVSDMSSDGLPPPPVSHVFVSNKDYLVASTEELTSAATAADTKQAQLRENLSLGAKLAAKTKGTRAADLLKKWDLKGDGVVSMSEFKQNIKTLGIEAKEEEVEELFNKLDGDSSGSLEIGELRITVPRLLEMSA